MTHKAFEQGEGILRLAPSWVPRTFCVPGRRIKLHPADYYAYGAHRGGIDERWIASTVKADNGPLTSPDEGLSQVVFGAKDNPQKITLADLIDDLGAEIIGDEFWHTYHRMPAYTKFFDNKGALPHHLHPMAEHAALVGTVGKPEAYYFLPQLNNYGGDYPYTFFGLEPNTTKEQVRHCLEIWAEGDNHITELSKAYQLEVGTGWDVPPGILHAPGSLCTYEPQWYSDAFAMYQSMVAGAPVDRALLVKDVPPDKHQDLDYLVSMIDWPANLDSNFKAAHFRMPAPVKPVAEMEDEGYLEKWIVYGNKQIAAKELTVLPGRTVTIRDAGPYGVIVVQGHGQMGSWPVEAPALIRFGQLTYDEFFVSDAVARAGVTISNPSPGDPLVILKNFGPNPEAPEA